jgi:CHAT domain-containing protein/tetratricopeptide (TPR) repeat protein
VELHRARGDKANPVAYAGALNNLADLARAMEDWPRAEVLLQEAIAHLRRTVGEEHPFLAICLTQMASLHREAGNTPEALSLLQQAIRVEQQFRGENHPDYATLLNELGLCLIEQGQDAGEAHLNRSLQLRRSLLGEDHPDVAQSLNGLGVIAERKGDFAEAERLQRRALEIRQRSLGDEHPSVAESLSNLGLLLARVGRLAEALAMFERQLVGSNRMISQVLSISSERQAAGFLTQVWREHHAYLSLVKQHFATVPETVRATLDVVLRRKCLQAEAIAARRDAVLGGHYPHLREPLRQLTELRQQVARKVLAGPGLEGMEAHRELLRDWSRQIDDLEAQLARQVPEMRLEALLRSADRRAVALALPAETVLVEFVRFADFDFPNRCIRGESYVAFVLPAGESDVVHLIDLGPAGPIDRWVTVFRAGVTGDAQGEAGHDREVAERRPGSSLPEVAAEAGRALWGALVALLTPALGGSKRLLLAVDGDLARLPFEVLPTGRGRHLIEEYRISYLTSGRDALRFPAGRGEAGPAAVYCDPAFDLGQLGLSSAPGPLVSRAQRLQRAHLHFGPLPGTRAEGERVARLLGVRPWTGAEAVEGRLKGCCSPWALHLATHGFFLPAQQIDPRQFPRRNLALTFAGAESLPRPLCGPGMENPMLHSGLALAGANTFLKGGAPPEDAEDGLLTAEDVAGLDLLNTELAVLSACDTGLGKIHSGEGVFGLRRAFVLAGVRTLVMSLWKVSDLATAFLMDRFYDNLLTRGLDRDLALSEAQKATRDVTVRQLRAEWLSDAAIDRLTAGDAEARRALVGLARQPDGHRPFEHPSYWGAFICQGDTAPLPGSGPTCDPVP